jgi:hypothetical protein
VLQNLLSCMFQEYFKIRPSFVWKNVNCGSSSLQGMHWRYQLQSMWLQMWLCWAVQSIILRGSTKIPFARLSCVLYECYWNESSLRSVKRECIRKIPWAQVSYRNNIKDLVNNARTDMLIDRKPECRVLTQAPQLHSSFAESWWMSQGLHQKINAI